LDVASVPDPVKLQLRIAHAASNATSAAILALRELIAVVAACTLLL